MNKTEFIQQLADKLGITKSECKEIYQDIIDVMKDGINEGKLSLPEIGTFEKKFKPSKQVRNPRTKEYVMSKEKYTVKFSESTTCSRYINGEEDTEM